MEDDLRNIQKAIKEIDAQRQAKGLTKEQIELLELSAVAMREAERVAIARIQKSAIKNMEAKTSDINALAKEIRAKVTKMNKVPKTIDKIEGVIKIVHKVLKAVEKWI